MISFQVSTTDSSTSATNSTINVGATTGSSGHSNANNSTAKEGEGSGGGKTVTLLVCLYFNHGFPVLSFKSVKQYMGQYLPNQHIALRELTAKSTYCNLFEILT